ncbi:MAG: GIY-YIG nuclease family protein [Peptostreptococcaceae bacterium]
MYKGYAVYRFLDKNKKTTYIGMTNNAHRRIYQQHFTKRGHLPYECYNTTCRVDIIKLTNNLEAKGLEDYLINKYRPRFNKRDKEKDIFIMNKYGQLGEVYSNMESWTSFRTLKSFDDPTQPGKLSTKENIIFYILLAIALIGGLYLYSKFK